MSLSAMPLILRCTKNRSRPIEPRHQCPKWILDRTYLADGIAATWRAGSGLLVTAPSTGGKLCLRRASPVHVRDVR
jgi:hypothetical protein